MTPIEPAKRAPGRHEGLLDDIHGRLGIACVSPGEPEEVGLVATHDLAERRVLTGKRSRHQLDILGFDLPRHREPAAALRYLNRVLALDPQDIFGARLSQVPVSSTKAMHGHCIGATGATLLP